MSRYHWLIRHVLLFSILICCAVLNAKANEQSWPQTRAERTDYKETSHYSDVIDFLESLQSKGAPIDVQFIGTSPEGRRIPMVIAGRPEPAQLKHAGSGGLSFASRPTSMPAKSKARKLYS